MLIDGWECKVLYEGAEWAMRSATCRGVEVIADADGLDLEEVSSGYMGYTGRYWIPASVLMWLAAGVR